MSMVGGFIGTVNQNVIYVYNTKLVKVFSEHIIDEGLERQRSIGKSKGHDKVFEEAVTGSEGSFPLVTFLDSEKVVGATEVQLGVDFGVLESV